jgi:hypothetical protein
MIEIGKKVVVTTEYRGVFFGTLSERDDVQRSVTLTQARNCLYWASSVRGFIGLATSGPSDDSRVGPAAEILELAGVTSITLCSEEAIEKWEAGPWS